MILGIDHLVLTVRDPEAAAAFYNRVLGLDVVRFGQGRIALQCGDQKINLQSLGQETRNHAAIGCGDLCLPRKTPSPASPPPASPSPKVRSKRPARAAPSHRSTSTTPTET